MTLTFKVKLNLKVTIYPILSMLVCPRDKSSPIEVSISKFGSKMHLSTVKVPIDFWLDWPWSSVSFLISNLCASTKLCVSYSFASVCMYLVRPSPVNVPHSTGHRTYADSSMHVERVPPWIMKQSSFIYCATLGAQWSFDSAIGTGFYNLLSVFANLYTPHMTQFYIPTFVNHRSNSKTAPISLYFVRLPLWNPWLRWLQ